MRKHWTQTLQRIRHDPGRRIEADPEEVMRVLMRTPRSEIREEPVEYRAEPPNESE